LSPEQALIVEETLRQFEQSKEVFIITYPQEGGKHTFPAGTTMIDFYEGKITFGDGSEADLPNNLKSLDEPWMQSFFIETDQTISVSMENELTFYEVTQADYLGLTYQQFQRVYIKTSQNTNIKLWATTHPNAMITKVKTDRTGAQLGIITIENEPTRQLGLQYGWQDAVASPRPLPIAGNDGHMVSPKPWWCHQAYGKVILLDDFSTAFKWLQAGSAITRASDTACTLASDFAAKIPTSAVAGNSLSMWTYTMPLTTSLRYATIEL
jgi:hypothetical protein